MYMKSSTKMYYCIALVDTNILPKSSILVNSSTSSSIAGSYSASLLLINNYLAPVSNIIYIENPSILIGKYKWPCYIFNIISFI